MIAVKKHFTEVARSANTGATLPLGRGCKREKPQKHMDGAVHTVAEVTVALHQVGPELLETYLERADLKHEMSLMELKMMKRFSLTKVAEIPKTMRQLSSGDATKADKAWYEAFNETREALSDNMADIKALQRKSGFPAVAFVTFESWETACNVSK